MACCGKSEADPNNITNDPFYGKDSHTVSADKLRMIIKIQALLRGALARKRVK
jgi:hypothetical protein